MKGQYSIYEILLALTCLCLPFLFQLQNSKPCAPLKPYEEFHFIKNYPNYSTGFQRKINALNKLSIPQTSKTSDKYASYWNCIGPYNISGRFNTIAINKGNDQTIYAGSASGGIFKTSNGGNTWQAIFDDKAYLAIGHIVISSHDSNTVYVGTGDPNISGYPWVGNGVYKSSDAGKTWTHIGLDSVGIVSKIVIHPKNEQIIYAATMGIPFIKNMQRGLYKSTDGGISWHQILSLSDDAGIIDMLLLPSYPDTIFAAGWNRIRNNNESIVSGAESKVYRSLNGGETWETMLNGLPQNNMARIGLTATKHNTVVAQIISPESFETEGIYSTENFGDSWQKIEDSNLPGHALGGFGWYFGKIRANPFNAKQIFVLGVQLYKSNNGGITFNPVGQTQLHADKHDLVFIDSSTFILATDGGLYKSTNGGNDWIDIENIANTQVYRIAVDPFKQEHYCCGAQDNGTNIGNHADSANWKNILGGDGFQAVFDYTDSTIIYGEMQNGNLYTGKIQNGNITWTSFEQGINQNDYKSWDTPLCMSKINAKTLFTATSKVYKNTNAPTGNWIPISNDLTKGSVSRYQVITTIDVSPFTDDHIVAGTSDGNLHIYNGNNWLNVSEGLPDRYFTDVQWSPDNKHALFASNSGYKDNENIPHIHYSDSLGTNWRNISGNLPHLAINSLVCLPEYNDSVIFVGTDGGVYHSINRGDSWERTGFGMPMIAVYDLAYDDSSNSIIAGTFARSVMRISLNELIKPVESPSNKVISSKNTLVSVFPNPANEAVHIKTDSKPESIKIVNSRGNICYTKKGGELTQTINLSGFASGLYYVIITTNNRKQHIKKLVINKK